MIGWISLFFYLTKKWAPSFDTTWRARHLLCLIGFKFYKLTLKIIFLPKMCKIRLGSHKLRALWMMCCLFQWKKNGSNANAIYFGGNDIVCAHFGTNWRGHNKISAWSMVKCNVAMIICILFIAYTQVVLDEI